MRLSRQQLTLLGIFALFFGPLLLVIMMRSSWWQYQPSGLKNNGQLIQPPVPVALNNTQNIAGKWVILYVLESPCNQGCKERITTLRQTHRASGRHGENLAIVLLSEATLEPTKLVELESIYPAFVFATDLDRQTLNALTNINLELIGDPPKTDDARTYILDPLHNVILAYALDANPGDMHKDLKRLLKWSDQENR